MEYGSSTRTSRGDGLQHCIRRIEGNASGIFDAPDESASRSVPFPGGCPSDPGTESAVRAHSGQRRDPWAADGNARPTPAPISPVSGYREHRCGPRKLPLSLATNETRKEIQRRRNNYRFVYVGKTDQRYGRVDYLARSRKVYKHHPELQQSAGGEIAGEL